MTTTTDVPVFVVRSSITGGHRHHEDEIVAGLDRAHREVTEAQIRYPHEHLFGRSVPTGDLYHAVQSFRVVRRADPGTGPVVFTTMTDALLQPAAVLRRAVVRFDALNRENRLGWRGLVQRALERRVFRRAAVLAPRSVRALPERADLALRPLPSAVVPLDPMPEVATDPPYLFLYGGANMRKKGLDVAVDAWRIAAVAGAELRIAGTDPELGRRFLRERGVSEPANVRWLGQVTNAEFRAQAAAATAYVSASRFEEFGVAQLEAFVDGVPVVTVTTGGPVEIVPVMRAVAPELVADGVAAPTLAAAMRAALAWTSEDRARFRTAARDVAAAYSRAAVADYLAAAVRP